MKMSKLFFNEFVEEEEEEIDELSEKLNNVVFPSNSIIISKAIKNNEKLDAIYDALKEYTNYYEKLKDHMKDPCDIALIIGLVQYHFQNSGFLTKRNSATYKINLLGKVVSSIVIFNEEQYAEKLSKSKGIDTEIIQSLPFNLDGLPSIAQLLANGILLTKKSIELRISWMTNMSGYKFPDQINEEQVTSSEDQMKRLIQHLIRFRKEQYRTGWQKVGRYFLTGLMMDSHYSTLTGNKDKKKIRNTKSSAYVATTRSIISKCNSILKKETVLENVMIELAEKYDLLKTDCDFNILEAKRNLLKDLKTDLKLSYLLYHFVRMFGYIALVSSPIATSDYLLKKLNFNDLEEMRKKFDVLYTYSNFGEMIIKANKDYGESIYKVINKYAEYTNISNSIVKDAIKQINSSYSFLKFVNEKSKSKTNNSGQVAKKRGHYEINDSENYETNNLREELENLRNIISHLQNQNTNNYQNHSYQPQNQNTNNYQNHSYQLQNQETNSYQPQNQNTNNYQNHSYHLQNQETNSYQPQNQNTKKYDLSQIMNLNPFEIEASNNLNQKQTNQLQPQNPNHSDQNPIQNYSKDNPYIHQIQQYPQQIDQQNTNNALITTNNKRNKELNEIAIKEGNQSIKNSQFETNNAVSNIFILQPLQLNESNSTELVLEVKVRQDISKQIEIVEKGLSDVTIEELKKKAEYQMNDNANQYQETDKFLISYYNVLENFSKSFKLYDNDEMDTRINVVDNFIREITEENEKLQFERVVETKWASAINEEAFNMRSELHKNYLIYEAAMNEFSNDMEVSSDKY